MKITMDQFRKIVISVNNKLLDVLIGFGFVKEYNETTQDTRAKVDYLG